MHKFKIINTILKRRFFFIQLKFFSVFLNNSIFLFVSTLNKKIELFKLKQFRFIKLNMFNTLSLFINKNNAFINFLKIRSIIFFFNDFSFLQYIEKDVFLYSFAFCFNGFFLNIKYIKNIKYLFNIFNNNFFFLISI